MRVFGVNYNSAHVILHKPSNLKVVGCTPTISMRPRVEHTHTGPIGEITWARKGLNTRHEVMHTMILRLKRQNENKGVISPFECV